MKINILRKEKELWLQIGETVISLVDSHTIETASLPDRLVYLNAEEFIAFKTIWFAHRELIKAFEELCCIYRNNGDPGKRLEIKYQETLLKSDILSPEERSLFMHLWFERNAPPKKRNKGESFIYLMLDSATGFTKIGYSTNPGTRESTLQSEKPTIELISAWQGTYAEEQLLHKTYAEKRVRGEWFSLTENDLQQIRELFTDRTSWDKN